MMRALFSGVSGLKVHQTRMDVIGNNIANVNTVGFKASSVQFSDIFYQTTQNASGANELTGTAGTNAKQIGLGASLSSISAAMTKQGGSQRTDNATDLMISGNAFFVVNNGNGNYFTKNGAFTIDGGGYLATESGYYVQGWSPDPEDPTKIKQNTVDRIGIQTPENLSTPAEATTDVTFKGNIDKVDESLKGDGYIISSEFYDNLGNAYSAKYKLTSAGTSDGGKSSDYKVDLVDIVNKDGKSVVNDATLISSISFGGNNYKYDTTTEKLVVDGTDNGVNLIRFEASTGKFISTGKFATGFTQSNVLALTIASPADVAAVAATATTPAVEAKNLFGKTGTKTITVDCSAITQQSTTGACNISSNKGSIENTGIGKKKGALNGVQIQTDGKIYGTYDNGTSKLLGQIAVASFSNPAGLEAYGGSLFSATQNSGDFDGKGQDISSSGGKFSTGVLEMSNVDLSSEFTNMITTQRGFQANSRIITTSDTLLEELINLKR